jgi:hypothetical protein
LEDQVKAANQHLFKILLREKDVLFDGKISEEMEIFQYTFNAFKAFCFIG